MATLNLPAAPPADDAAPADGDDNPSAPVGRSGRHRRVSAPSSRVAYAMGIAAVCAFALGDLVASGPTASADPQEQSSTVAVADALGIDGAGVDAPVAADAEFLGQLTASRSQRDSEQAAAAASQSQAEQAAAAAQDAAQAEAEARAAAEAATAAAAAQAAAAAPAAATAVAKISNSAGSVRPQAQAAANAVVSNVPGADAITIGGTRASAADPGGHPSGLALDYMVGVALGDAIVEYHLAHWGELGVEYIIWQQRMLSAPNGSWTQMEDRGSPTANHMDHVHVNYR